MDKQPRDVAGLERGIKTYVQSHPHAVDTARGIHEWWLRDAPGCFDEDDVRAVLDHLVSTGELAMCVLPDGQHVYKRAPP